MFEKFVVALRNMELYPTSQECKLSRIITSVAKSRLSRLSSISCHLLCNTVMRANLHEKHHGKTGTLINSTGYNVSFCINDGNDKATNHEFDWLIAENNRAARTLEQFCTVLWKTTWNYNKRGLTKARAEKKKRKNPLHFPQPLSHQSRSAVSRLTCSAGWNNRKEVTLAQEFSSDVLLFVAAVGTKALACNKFAISDILYLKDFVPLRHSSIKVRNGTWVNLKRVTRI